MKRFSFTSPHMGTTFGITLYATNDSAAAEASEAAFERVAQLEDTLSDYMADSELMRLASAPAGDPVQVSEDLFGVLQHGTEISALTDGAFDLTAGPFTQLWRFSRKRGALPTEADLASAQAVVGWKHLLLNRNARTATLTLHGMRLDAGGIAKGYAADEAMRVLKEHGIDRALIAASGDILTSKPPPGTEGWTVSIAGTGVEQTGPRLSGWVGSGIGAGTGGSTRYAGTSTGFAVIGTSGSARNELPPQVLSIRNAAISTSGDMEQFVEINGVRYSHIVSPFTGLGLTNQIQATVIAPNATTSDALATACCVLGPKRAIDLSDSLPTVEVLVLTKDKGQPRVWRTKNAP